MLFCGSRRLRDWFLSSVVHRTASRGFDELGVSIDTEGRSFFS